LVGQSASEPVGQQKQLSKFKILHKVGVKCRNYIEFDIQFGYDLKEIHTEFQPGNLLESNCLKDKESKRRVTLSQILRKYTERITGEFKVAQNHVQSRRRKMEHEF
jgi:hypothetical protein